MCYIKVIVSSIGGNSINLITPFTSKACRAGVKFHMCITRFLVEKSDAIKILQKCKKPVEILLEVYVYVNVKFFIYTSQEFKHPIQENLGILTHLEIYDRLPNRD